jgi:hydrogenase maturation protease
MARILVVAYGNPMRCDDGLAWHAADELAKKFTTPDVEIVRTHQLAPELAETISRSEVVIFVDSASAGEGKPGEVRSTRISSSEGLPRFSHQFSPAAVLALARQLYNTTPDAFLLTLEGEHFDHGEILSPVVAVALPALVGRIEELIQQSLLLESPSPSKKA